jgi:choline dehydrogenase-like flavoprotein
MAEPLRADVVIVGAGIAGTLAGYRLARAGVKVLILDAGPRVDRDEALEKYRAALIKVPESPYPTVAHAPSPNVLEPNGYYVQAGPDTFKSTYLRLVGGTTWHWLGSTLRLLPSDFRMKTRFGVGVDWPIDYDELEPWYVEAEKELGVAGREDLGSPRSQPYPMTEIPLTWSNQRIAQALEGSGLTVTATAQARNSRVYDDRPPCCGAGSCIPLCPIVARYDAAVHVAKAEGAGVQLLPNAVAHFVEVGRDGRVSAVRFLRPDRSEGAAVGRFYVLAAHGIETPKLLLLSKAEGAPAGVANRSDQVGRNLMDHPEQLSWALANEPLGQHRGPLSTAGIDGLRATDERNARAAFRVEFLNDGWRWPVGGPDVIAAKLLEQGVRGKALAQAVSAHATRQLAISSLLEQLPDPENRVTLAEEKDALGLPRPRIQYRVGAYTRAGQAEARRVHDRIFDALGVSERHHREQPEGAGHIMGTYRMGLDPKTSVVDTQLKAHDHDNLYLLGSGTFPTGGSANPTLTITALALRAAKTLQTRLAG